MTFFPSEKIRDPISMDLAKTLFRGLVQHRIGKPKRSYITGWSEQIRPLVKQYGEDRTRLVMTWLCQHMKDVYVPKIVCGDNFRNKFLDLEKAMERAEPTPDRILPEAKWLAEEIKCSFNFPVEIQTALPGIIQKSMDNAKAFWLKIETWLEDPNRDSKGREEVFLCHVCQQYLPQLVHEWLAFLGRKFGYLPSYSGPVMSLAFRPISSWFRDSFWHKWSLEWANNPVAFDPLLDQLLEVK